MKNRLLTLIFLTIVGACRPVGTGFTAEEMDLIEGKGVMRVLKTDAPEDLKVLRLESKTLSDKMLKTPEYEALCKRMLITVQAPENDGVGIAAPQVGVSRRLIAVQRFDKEGEPFEFFANPEIVRYGREKAQGGEGCLSVPDLRGVVERAQDIDLRYRTAHGTDTLETVGGFTAVIFQHEIDHLNGILYTDRAVSTERDSQRNISIFCDHVEVIAKQQGISFSKAAEKLKDLQIWFTIE